MLATSKKMIKTVFVFCLMLAFVITSTVFADGVSAEASSTDKLTLIMDDDSDRFALSDEAGNKIYSYPVDTDESVSIEVGNVAKSNLVIEYVFKEEMLSDPKEYSADSYLGSVTNGDYEITDLENGFRIVYKFTSLGITIPVNFTVVNGYFEATVELSEIAEDGDTALTSITLLPCFAAGTSADEGSIFVPDGTGALINYNNGATETYEKNIYGDELASPEELKDDVSEDIKLPVFGSFSERQGMLGIVTSGASISSVIAESGDKLIGTYNIVSSKLIYRTIYLKKMLGGQNTASRIAENAIELDKYQVRYYVFMGKSVGIMDLAEIYRSYLISEKGLKKQEYESEFNINLIGAIDIEANFLGIPYRKIKSLTTYKQAEEIVEYFSEQGISNIAVKYSGWMKDGVSNKSLPKKVEYSSKLGGKKAFESLNTKLSEINGKLYTDVDLTTYRNGSSRNAIKNAFREVAWQNSYMPSVYATRLDVPKWKILSADSIFSITSKFFKSFKKSDADGVVLSAITSVPYSNLDSKAFISREQTVDYFEEVLKEANEQGIAVIGEESGDYSFEYISKIFSAPTSMSNENMMNERVPFYSLVLHGYLPMTSSSLSTAVDDYSFLTAVENGFELQYTGMYEDSSAVKDTAYDKYFSTNYLQWADDAINAYKEYYPILEKISGEVITEYNKLNDSVNAVTYENGITVYVNYSYKEETIQGKNIPARGFLATGF